MVYIDFKERTLHLFASNTKHLHILTRWNLGFTIVTLALKYDCHMGECSSNIAKIVLSATLFVQQPTYNQSTKRHIYIPLFCYDKINTKHGT